MSVWQYWSAGRRASDRFLPPADHEAETWFWARGTLNWVNSLFGDWANDLLRSGAYVLASVAASRTALQVLDIVQSVNLRASGSRVAHDNGMVSVAVRIKLHTASTVQLGAQRPSLSCAPIERVVRSAAYGEVAG